MRGPSHDGAVRDARLVAADGKVALTLGWKRDLGSGYSVLAAGDGRLIAMFASGDGDFAAAFRQETGEELWRYRIEEIYKGHDGSHDGPIASPLLAAGKVFGLTPRGILFAVDAATGKANWSKNLVAELGAKSPYYGFASSPILVDHTLIVQIGAGEGKAIAGFRPEDGTLLWSTGNDEINYQSPIAATVGGRGQVVAAGGKSLWGLDAASGKVLWSYEHQGDQSVMGGQKLIPVPAGEDRFLLVNKEDSSTMIRVSPGDGGTYQVKELWSKNSIRGTYVIPVYHEGYVYGVTGFILTCVDAATGETKWKSREPGDGFLTLVGGHLVILTKQGTLHVAEASPAGYHELARMDLFDEQSWSAVAYADGHLFARSMAHLARIDVATQATPPPTVTAARSWTQETEFGRFLAEAAKAPDKGSAIDKYLKGQRSFPIVEDTGAVHFIYRGKATDVAIVGDMIGDRREDPMLRFADTDLFYYSTRLERNASVTYGFIVDYDKPIADARNPRKGSGPFGEVSLLAMPGWKQAEYTSPPDTARQGRLETLEFTSHAGGKEKQRTAQVYLPAGYETGADKRFPTLYVHDGKDALEKGGMKNMLDAVIGKEAEPLIGVFILPDPENPQGEMWQIDPYVEMVVTDLVPKVDERYRTVRQPQARATAGAGGGANAALACVLKHPEVFQRLGSQSAWVLGRADYEGQIPTAEKQPLTIFLQWGTYDMRSSREAWDTAKGNRELWALLRERSYRPSGGETPEGTGWGFWRGHAGEMVTALFPRRTE
ncbi:MAG TPA: PQQ-binding-like beta-propeller repeat protein [Candidatus Polarisedimenticolia bacterium]|jgi:enterochelin esterase-like enzyme/outer membrane protein assembly factor BamB